MIRRNKLTVFGTIAKKRMIDINMSHSELAKRIGCGPNYLCAIFSGVRSGAKYENAICRELGLDDMPVSVQRRDNECKRDSA